MPKKLTNLEHATLYALVDAYGADYIAGLAKDMEAQKMEEESLEDLCVNIAGFDAAWLNTATRRELENTVMLWINQARKIIEQKEIEQ